MSELDLKELRRLAMAANGDASPDGRTLSVSDIARAYIAVSRPDVVLALLDRLEAAERDVRLLTASAKTAAKRTWAAEDKLKRAKEWEANHRLMCVMSTVELRVILCEEGQHA